MEEGRLPSGKYTWRINSFSKKTARQCTSETFTVEGCNWQIHVYPITSTHPFALYLGVADAASLPVGWCRHTQYSFTLVDQYNAGDSKTKGRGCPSMFNATSSILGFREFVPLSELHDQSRGFVVNDTMVVEVEMTVHKVVPPVELATQIGMFDSFFSTFFNNFGAAGISPPGEGTALDLQTDDLVAEAPTADDIEEEVKHLLKEYVLDLIMFDVLDLAGLSQGTSKANFDDFFIDYLTFVRDNSDFELQKIGRDRRVYAMKRNYKTHLLYNLSFDNLTEEKEQLTRKLKEVSSREAKLMFEWESLVNKSKEVNSIYVSQEKKLAEAKEKKRTAEESVPPPTNAPTSLKERLLRLLCVPI